MFVSSAILNTMPGMRYILPVILLVNCSAIFAKSVDAPGSVKTPAGYEWEMLPELTHGLLQGWKVPFKNANDCCALLGPVGRCWVKPLKLSKDRSAEGQTCRSVAGAAISFAAEKMREIRSHQSSNKPDDCDAYCGVYVSLPFWLMALYFGCAPAFKPNAK